MHPYVEVIIIYYLYQLIKDMIGLGVTYVSFLKTEMASKTMQYMASVHPSVQIN